MARTSLGARAVVLLATIVGIAATARLGVWQLDRAAAKNAVQARIEARAALPPLDAGRLPRSAGEAEGEHYRRAAVRGRWADDRTVYLDNRQMNGVPGFFVVTPLLLAGGTDVVVVERGWVPRDFYDRARLPPLRTPPGEVIVEGLIAPPPSRLYAFGPDSGGPIRQNLELDAYARETGLRLLPFAILQAASPAAAGDGLQRQWPLPAADVQKHYGYAFQWFAMAATMAALYVWFQLIRPARQQRRA